MAGTPRAEYEIGAKDDTKSGINSATSNLKDFKKNCHVRF